MALCLNMSQEAVIGLLSELQRRGLTERLRSTESDVTVYRVHDLTYSYARANSLLSKAAAIDACREYTARHTSSLNALDAEIGNLLGAARVAQRIGMPDLSVEIMHLLAVSAGYCDARGYSAETLDLLIVAAQTAEAGGQIERAHYLYSKLGNACLKFLEQFDHAFDYYDHALTLAQQIQDQNREILMLALVGTSRFRQGADDPDAYYERAYQLAQICKDEKALATVLNHRSYYEGQKDPPDFERSRLFSDEAVELARRQGKHECQFASLMNRGNCERLLGYCETALATHEEALGLAEHHNNRFWKASALQALGEDRHELGQHAEAQIYFDQSLALWLDTDAIPRARSLVEIMSQSGYAVNAELP
jgi:tetratricopeptide (TPR) repeat protein